MLERILVALDGTAEAEELLGPVTALVRQLGSTLTLAYILACPYCSPPAPAGDHRKVPERDLRAGCRYLGQVRDRLAHEAVPAETVACIGHPEDILVDLAAKGTDVIALRPDDPVPNRVFDELPVRLLERTRVPLLLFRAIPAHPWPSFSAFRTVLVSADGDPVRRTGALAAALGCELVGSRVVPGQRASSNRTASWDQPGVVPMHLARRFPQSLMMVSADGLRGRHTVEAMALAYESGLAVLLVPEEAPFLDESIEGTEEGGDPWQTLW